MLSLNPSYYGSVFVTPKTIVEKYIKMASFCALKSLLWILNNQGGNFSVEEIAKAIGSSVADTNEAIEYWVNEGILIKNGESAVVPSPTVSDSHLKLKEAENKPKRKKPKRLKKHLHPKSNLSARPMSRLSRELRKMKTLQGFSIKRRLCSANLWDITISPLLLRCMTIRTRH